MADGEVRSEVVSVRFAPSELREMLQAVAPGVDPRYVQPARIIRDAVLDYCARHNGKDRQNGRER